MGIVVDGGGWCLIEFRGLCLAFGSVLGILGCRGFNSGSIGAIVCRVDVVGCRGVGGRGVGLHALH